MHPPNIKLLTVAEFCETYRIGATTAFALMKSGAIERRKVGSATRIPVESAERWFAGLPRMPAATAPHRRAS